MNSATQTNDIFPLSNSEQFGVAESRLQLDAVDGARPHAAGSRNSNNGSPSPSRRNLRRNVFVGAAAAIVVMALSAYYVRYVAPYESTDDAFIEGHVMAVSPRVSGQVASVAVKDNQLVKRGDVLLQIDPRDYEVRVDQARANLNAAKSRLAEAEAQVTVDQAKADQEAANVTAAGAEAKRTQADLKRYQAVESRAVSRSQIDLAETQASATAAQVEVARDKALAAQSQVGLSKANIETAKADISRNEAALRQAELDLSYTKVTAPDDGVVTRKSVEEGAYVQTGQSLLALVPREVWVVANFKETQLPRMQPGQHVEIKVDAYPQRKFKAHVDSIQSGSGARFSLLPPENASGNFVKVVQRVPVKIVFDDPSETDGLFGPGMSVVPEVLVR